MTTPAAPASASASAASDEPLACREVVHDLVATIRKGVAARADELNRDKERREREIRANHVRGRVGIAMRTAGGNGGAGALGGEGLAVGAGGQQLSDQLALTAGMEAFLARQRKVRELREQQELQDPNSHGSVSRARVHAAPASTARR